MTSSNDNQQSRFDDPVTLRREIERLRGELTRSELRFKEMSRLANRDELVGLPNRRSFLLSLQHTLLQVQGHGFKAAVLFADMDGLKLINDKYGHPAGDRALIKVAHVLIESVRKEDIAARLGGDEFAV